METFGSALPGTVLDGRYRVGGVIARGGMSTVYRGLDTRLDRPVAIKVMSPAYVSDPAFLARFEREARTAAGLHHPGVVAVYDQGRDGETVFLVMELIDGGTLRDLLRDGPLSVEVSLSILEPLLGALGAAHAAGLVHRDVKPENVLISGRGEVKVADFGLVRAVTSQTVATGDVILGTVAYLSPEQVATGSSDARSDVYSAAIVSFEMLTGHPPFSGDNAISVAYQHVHSDVPPVTDTAPGVPLELDDLLLAATRRDPDQRPRDAAAFLSAVVSVRARLGMARVRVPAPRTRPVTNAGQPPVGGSSTTGPANGPQGTRVVPMHRPATVAAAPIHQRPGASAPPSQDPEPAARPSEPAVTQLTIATDAGLIPPAGRRRMRRWLIAILVILLLGTAAAVGGWWLGSGRWADTPAAVGLDQQSAIKLVQQAGLVPAVTTALNDDQPSGEVASSSPVAGSRQLRGSQVDLVISTGRPHVPTIAPGTAADTAAATISLAHLTPILDASRDVYSTTVAAGTVVATEPAAGTAMLIGAKVMLIKSKGGPPLPIPGVAGKSVDDAKNALLANGFTVGNPVSQYTTEEPAGTVLGTTPAAGTPTPQGTAVSLLMAVSLTVPDVSGESVSDATAQLTAAGFTVTTGDPVYDGNVAAGNVSQTDPGAGALVDPAHPDITLTPSDSVTVPSLTDGNRQQAEQALSTLGLQIDVHTLIGSQGSPVVDQSPSAGSLVAPGSTVVVSVFP